MCMHTASTPHAHHTRTCMRAARARAWAPHVHVHVHRMRTACAHVRTACAFMVGGGAFVVRLDLAPQLSIAAEVQQLRRQLQRGALWLGHHE